MERTEVAVVGAGPIGLETAIALKRAGIDFLHFDKGQIGQMIYSFPYQTRFFSSSDRIAIAGIPLQTVDQSKATREEYLAYLRSVVEAFDLDVRTFEAVLSIEARDDGFMLKTRSSLGERTCLARKVILTTGGTAVPRSLNIPGEDLPHVSHHLEDPHLYFRKRVLVVGGKNSAVEAALRCYNAGARVSISYRRAAFDEKHVKYWLRPELLGRIERNEIKAFLKTEPTAITPTHVTLKSCEGGDTVETAADFVLLMVGYVADMSLFRMAGITLLGPEEAPKYNEDTMETDVPGIYVAGTAVGGTQSSFKVFIENSHIHVDRILASLRGTPPPETPESRNMLES
ncbi:MAG: NAD(P)-binding domain-containing protein [Planctomycetota bacterium]|jgi:thioredoxin reductase (NADPH)